MDLMNCRECGQLFIQVLKDQKNCKDCFSLEMEELKILRHHIQSKGKEKITIQELSRITGVRINKIIKWVKEGSIISS